MKFSDEILALFEETDGGIELVERYKISHSGKKVDGLLCYVYLGRQQIPRVEAVLVAEVDTIIILLDGRSTISVGVDIFRQFVPFLHQAVTG